MWTSVCVLWTARGCVRPDVPQHLASRSRHRTGYRNNARFWVTRRTERSFSGAVLRNANTSTAAWLKGKSPLLRSNRFKKSEKNSPRVSPTVGCCQREALKAPNRDLLWFCHFLRGYFHLPLWPRRPSIVHEHTRTRTRLHVHNTPMSSLLHCSTCGLNTIFGLQNEGFVDLMWTLIYLTKQKPS